MEMPTFIYNVFPSKKREELISKRNVRVIKEYLKKREQLMNSKENDLARLKQLRKNKSIRASTYRRLKKIMIYTHEQKRIDLIMTSEEKSVSIGNPSVCHDDQASEDDQQIVSKVENN